MRTKVFALILCALCMVPAIQAKKTALNYNLQKGTKYYMNQVSTQNIHQDIHGMSNDMKVMFGGKISFDVYDIIDGIYQMKITYETLSFKMESSMFNMAFDSEIKDTTENPMGQALGAIIGVKFDAKMNGKGNIISITGFEDIYKGMVDSLGGNKDMAGQIAENLKQQFGDEAMKGSIEMMTAVFPDNEVSVGETWIKSTTIKGGMSLVSNNTYTLTDDSNNVWKLTGSAILATTPGSVMEMNGMTQQFDMKGSSTFDMQLDTKTGWVISNVVNQTIDGKVAIEGGQLPASMEIPMKVVSETKVTN